jgi:hypothetical protein
MQSNPKFMTEILILVAIAIGTILWVELVRDSYHTLAHYWKPLGKLHNWHHRVFRPDYTPVNDTIYCQAHWYNDVPEALVMLTSSLIPLGLLFAYDFPRYYVALTGTIYTLSFLITAISRAMGIPYAEELTDITHRKGEFKEIPSHFMVNRPYHWRHHFDDQDAYFCGTFTILDQIMGTALSLKGKKIAVTGASGSLGKALLKYLHLNGAKVIALTSSQGEISLKIKEEIVNIPTINWQINQEQKLISELEKIDILILNHGINVHQERDQEAIINSYQINTFSQLKLMDLFFETVKTNQEKATKEIWVNTSEAEVNPSFSPLYELSKRALGQLITMRRLDAPCIVRKLILGPFKSNLNPIGIMSADWVGKQIVNSAKRDFRNIIVTINPITFMLFPIKEFFVSIYFKLFTHKKQEQLEIIENLKP